MATIGLARREELPGLVKALSDEFIFRKGRTLAVDARFRSAFPDEPIFTVAREGNEVVATAAARPFQLQSANGVTDGAMVGLVYTAPSHRGRGLASQVMKAIAAQEQAEGRDLLVLWTSIHDFYSGLGWQTSDRSVFGSTARRPGEPEVKPVPLTSVDPQTLEQNRTRYQAFRVTRDARAWSNIPSPATQVDAFVTPNGHALVGRFNDVGYLYELLGDPETIGPSVLASYATVNVNDVSGSASARWFAANGVALQPQTQTMWLSFTPRGREASQTAHISYFDRI